MTQAQTQRFDIVISGGSVIDGTGAPARRADIGLAGDRIAAVGDLAAAQAGERIDARGKSVAPGFIDTHTHDDRALLAMPDMAMKVSQGVTSIVAGNCGVSIAPWLPQRDPPPPLDLIGAKSDYRYPRFADYLAALDAAPAAINVAALAGHSTLRVGAMDSLDRPATAGEIDAMAKRLDEAMGAGAIGLSTGLFYPPARAAHTSEVIELAKVAAKHGGLYATHMRDEGDKVLDSLAESFEIGRAAHLPVVISHHKVMGRRNHGRSRDTLAVIADARQRQPIAIDVYPYIAGSTALFPERIGDAGRTIVTWSRAMPEMRGRDLADIARDLGCGEREAAERLLPAGAIYFMMDEDDVRRILAWPEAMIGSDGIPHDEHPHPRLWGTFPRVLGHYSRDLGLIVLEDAVKRMTSIPAERFGLKDRGAIRAGAYADLVVFDPATIIDRATFEKPIQTAAGIERVLVNGREIWRNGAPTGARPGRALRRKDLDPPMQSLAWAQ